LSQNPKQRVSKAVSSRPRLCIRKNSEDVGGTHQSMPQKNQLSPTVSQNFSCIATLPLHATRTPSALASWSSRRWAPTTLSSSRRLAMGEPQGRRRGQRRASLMDVAEPRGRRGGRWWASLGRASGARLGQHTVDEPRGQADGPVRALLHLSLPSSSTWHSVAPCTLPPGRGRRSELPTRSRGASCTVPA
jgi:hypothetical protein